MAKLINLKAFQEFFRSQSFSGILLIICVAISLIIANSGIGLAYEEFLDTKIGFNNDAIHLKFSVLTWINDGLMAIFFLLVGLEIKRELVEGELSSLKQALLPIFAALGGMLIPAVIYSLINFNEATSSGWGIPMATDIAFAIAILAILGNRVPNSLKIFLTALAIVDDLGAILVIAIFYTSALDYAYLPYIIAAILALAGLNYFNVKYYLLYLIPGVFLWYFVHGFGIHATIAGVVTAFFLPSTADDEPSALEKLEHLINTPVNLIIMPIFALANTNIRFENEMVSGLFSPLGMGIILGLLLGKPLGISLFSFIAIKLKLSTLPENVNWQQIIGAGILAGIGFTMSIFIALLSIYKPEFKLEAKFAILIASLAAGITGYFLLLLIDKKSSNKKQ